MSIFSRFKKKRLKRKNKQILKEKLATSHPLEKGSILFENVYPLHKMGFGSYGMPKVFNAESIECKLTIGKFCSIADGVKIILGGRHFANWATTSPIWILDNNIEPPKSKPKFNNNVIIENDVWIATDAIILSPVRLGNGCIVAAGSMVTKDVPPYAIVAGNPAKIIKYRFSPDIIEKLLDIAWWDYPVDEIKKISPILNSENIDALINYSNNRKTAMATRAS
ncbi:CatB-related O-acetyltransferase [Entomomonas asaccharolytica]|uniref:CatB-related O-acetyltransferase n=1 Tax=Entomomonas asaccharolytica TaxID=2785331 RepID=A0A974NEN5_9GAMM|nr:CatB-related O-acetyltransferase [Entomomonas asaccharolytica]QQP84992.1 CatB-related O-acetyltransferase [Entomomonas asaccharolytica]